jgi:uncharacterized delta-60 repeat protein
MIKVNSNSLNLKGGKTLVGDFEYNGKQLTNLLSFGGTIYTTCVQSDNKIVLGGYFTTYSGSIVNSIVRINPDTTIDYDFNTGGGFFNLLAPDNIEVYSIIQQPDGKLVVGGYFSSYSGSNVNGMVRINPSGSIDFDLKSMNSDSSIYSIIQQSDGKLVVGGDFTSYSGSEINSIVRINPSGSIDPDFNVSGGFNRFGAVNSIIQQSDGKLVAGGNLTSYSGSAVNRIVRINPSGSIDPDFNVSGGFNSTLRTIIQQSDNKLVVGGDFTSYSGSANNRIVRINSSGSIDTTFAISGGFNNTVHSLIQQPDGKIVAGGRFLTYSGSASNRIIRINPSGSIDPTFAISEGFNGAVFRIIQQSDGRLIIGGQFTSYSGSNEGTYDGIINLNEDGTINNNFNINGGVRSINFFAIDSILPLSNKDILVGGDFSRINVFPFTQSISNLVLLDENLNLKQNYPVLGTVRTIIQQPDNKLVVVGDFTSYSGSAVNRIVRINPDTTIDPDFNISGGFNSFTLSAIQQSDGKLVVGGSFSSYSGSAVNGIVRINPSGSIDTTFAISEGFNGTGTVRTIIQQSDNKLVVGGDFTSYSGSANNRIVRINPNGTKDTTFVIGTGLNNTSVRSIVQQSDNKLVVIGNFTTYSGSANNGIVRINPNGTKDTTFAISGGFNGVVYSIIQQSDNKLVVGGDFTSYSGSASNRIVRINPSGSIDPTFDIGTGFNDVVNSINQQSDGRLIVGGADLGISTRSFTAYSGSSPINLVIINPSGSITKERTN